MILKIKDVEGRWWMYDNLTRVITGRYAPTQDLELSWHSHELEQSIWEREHLLLAGDEVLARVFTKPPIPNYFEFEVQQVFGGDPKKVQAHLRHLQFCEESHDRILDKICSEIEQLCRGSYQLQTEDPHLMLVQGDSNGARTVAALDKNNNEMLFVFDTEAYILNDDGKTVEVLR